MRSEGGQGRQPPPLGHRWQETPGTGGQLWGWGWRVGSPAATMFVSAAMMEMPCTETVGTAADSVSTPEMRGCALMRDFPLSAADTKPGLP